MNKVEKKVKIVAFKDDKEARLKNLDMVKESYSKKGYEFKEYIDNGKNDSYVIFLVDKQILKKDNIKKYLGWGIAIIIFLFLVLPSDGTNKSNKKVITPQSLTKEWPFTVNEAVLKCYIDNGIKSPVVEINGTPYGLTGFADNLHGQSNINALNKFIRRNPNIKGTRIDIGEVTKEALKLCN